MNRFVKIGNHTVSADSPVYLIAEMSGNHNMDYDRAEQIVTAAARAGANAIKLQTYTADTITLNCENEYFQLGHGTLWDGQSLHSLYEKAYTPWEWHKPLREKAHALGLDFFSSPFDATAVDFLEELNVPAYKIASFEITDIPLLRKVASTGKPLIISTGIARKEDITLALQTCAAEGNENVILLKCCSAYPSPFEDINLRVIPSMQRDFDCLVGLSDHTMGDAVPVSAVTLGARVVEKHLTLARADGGVDAAFSMEPAEFAQMAENIRNVEKALGSDTYQLTKSQEDNRFFSRSLFVATDMKAGDLLTPENLRSVRPGTGLHTKHYEELLGKRVTRDIAAGTPATWEMIQ